MYITPEFLLGRSLEVIRYVRAMGGDDGSLVYLLRLWAMAERHWPTGEMGEVDEETVANFVDHPDAMDPEKAQRFDRALIASKLIERRPDGTVRIVFTANGKFLVRFGSPPSDYGSSWPAARRAARERDGGQCQSCGQSGALDVHHIRPIRSFAHPEAANDLGNLVTLCRPCHVKAELQRRSDEDKG